MKKLLTVALIIFCIVGSLSCKAKKSDKAGQFGSFPKKSEKETKSAEPEEVFTPEFLFDSS